MRVLVTGGAGFTGSPFVRELLSGTYPDLEPSRVIDGTGIPGARQISPGPLAEEAPAHAR